MRTAFMRQEVLNRLRSLVKERSLGGWRDGWIYGRLKQEFTLSVDELNSIASVLGFKYGWNSLVEEVLEGQWQQDEKVWRQQQKAKEQQEQALVNRKMFVLQEDLKASGATLTDLEELLITMLLRMNTSEQLCLLETLCKHPLSIP